MALRILFASFFDTPCIIITYIVQYNLCITSLDDVFRKIRWRFVMITATDNEKNHVQVEETKTKQRMGLESVLSEFL